MSDSTFTQPPPDRTLKIPHLVFGLLFLGVAIIWAFVAADVITPEGLVVLAPAVLIAAGVIGLAASLASGRNRRTRQREHDLRAAHETYDPDQYDPDQYGPDYYSPDQYSPDQYSSDPYPPAESEGDDHTKEIR
jgi:hypothetical protein